MEPALAIELSINHGEMIYKTMAGGKKANQIQVNMREPSGRNRNGWNRSMNMGLDLAWLTTETGTSPETLVPRQSRPHELG